MVSATSYRRNIIRQNQTKLLYESVIFSAVGTCVASIVVPVTFSPYTDTGMVWTWYALVNLVYIARIVDMQLYRRASNHISHARYWMIRFNTGALLASVAWSSSLWLVFPKDHPPYQVLLILTLVGVAGGALAALPYDRRLNLTYQLIIVLSVLLRLLTLDSAFALEVAMFCFFVFAFLLSCGEKVGRNYLELLRLKQDMQESNLTLIKTTEQMARTGYWQWNGASPTIELSENLADMWGFSRRHVRISECFKRLHRADRLSVRRGIELALQNREEATVEYRIVDRKLQRSSDMRQVIKPLLDSQDRTYWLGTVQDISDIRSAEQTIYKMAYYDDLTGLANRANFHEQLRSAVDQARQLEQQLSLVYIDLDDFKGVNDSYGHEVGDSYLKAFAEHLHTVVRRPDLIARLGGDEFCVLLHDTEGQEGARDAADQILRFSRQSVQIGNHRIYPKLSIGISLFPVDGMEPDDLVKSADLAMYNVKHNGKHDYVFYDSRMGEDSLETARLEADFRTALLSEEFELWYQPQIDLIGNRISGVEALIRWRHPERGLVPPDVFISLAERVGMIKDIGEWVLQSACAQLADWKQRGYRLQMAVNISGDHFTSEGFCQFVERTARAHGLVDGELEIEITESLSRDPQEHYRVCHALRAAGFRVAIDDFGTGYSSLSVLQNLGVDALKIDRSFVNGLPDDHAAQLLVSAISEMSLGLGYEVVAEGVETREQLEFLRSLGCTHVQGFLFSRPVQRHVIPELIDAGHTLQRAA